MRKGTWTQLYRGGERWGEHRQREVAELQRSETDITSLSTAWPSERRVPSGRDTHAMKKMVAVKLKANVKGGMFQEPTMMLPRNNQMS